MRTAIIAGLCVILGAVFGAMLARQKLMPQVEAASSLRDDIEGKYALLQEDADLAKQRLAFLEDENARLRDDVTKWQGMYNTAAATAGLVDPAAAFDPEAAGSASANPELGVFQGDNTGQVADLTNQSVPEEQRMTFVLEKQRLDDFLQQAQLNETDPAARDRISAMDEYLDYTKDLFRQLREAQTPDERNRLNQQINESRGQLRGLISQQQDYEVQRVLQNSGITDPGQQSQFIQSLRQTQSSPFFTSPMLVWGAAPPPQAEIGVTRSE